jgi:hypothetical protein
VRVLVTGSRKWTDEQAVCWALYTYGFRWAQVKGEPLTIVHGACAAGADRMADDWGRAATGCEVERWPADWRQGKAAGPARNQAMVDAGADICLAFRCPKSRGTVDCIRRARAAGILTYVWDEQ